MSLMVTIFGGKPFVTMASSLSDVLRRDMSFDTFAELGIVGQSVSETSLTED